MRSEADRLTSICICTFKRPAGLALCLESVARLRVPVGVTVEVIVVDNDSAASARNQVLGLAQVYPFSLRYSCEPRSGVGHARNRCVTEARGEWVAFVDDDEYVSAEWLHTLLTTARRGHIDGVFGPVVAEFELEPPAWLLASGAHRRPRFMTGTPMRWGDCRTGNVLFRRSLFVKNGGFDSRYAASGGEDCDFFWRCMTRGAKLVWCDEAVVRERVPAERMSRSWVLQRALNGGRSFARLRASRGGFLSYAMDALWGIAGIGIYATPALVARALRLDGAVALERKVAGGVGKLVAGFGLAHGEYGEARIAGRTP